MSAEAMERALEATTGENWSTLVSDTVGRGTYLERYGFAWRDAEVSWVDGAVVYIDDRDAFAREPLSARFETADGYRFVMASVYLVYGNDVAARQQEATALGAYRDWLEASFPETPLYIAGDFALSPDDVAWSELGDAVAPIVTEGATTLSPVSSPSRYAHHSVISSRRSSRYSAAL